MWAQEIGALPPGLRFVLVLTLPPGSIQPQTWMPALASRCPAPVSPRAAVGGLSTEAGIEAGRMVIWVGAGGAAWRGSRRARSPACCAAA